MVKIKDKNVLGGYDVYFFYLIVVEGVVVCSYERFYILYIDFVSNNCLYIVYFCISGFEYVVGYCLLCIGIGCLEMGYNFNNFFVWGFFYFDIVLISLFCGK